MMKKILTLIVLITFGLLVLGVTCVKRKVEIPILDSESVPIVINTSESDFSEVGMYDATDLVIQIRDDNGFLEVIEVNLQAVTYTITANNSTPNTLVNGVIEVSNSAAGPFETIIELTDVDLTDIEDVEQKPDLSPTGVEVIHRALSLFIGRTFLGGTKQIWFRVRGTGSPAPPPNINFEITIKVYLIVVGLKEVTVPTGP